MLFWELLQKKSKDRDTQQVAQRSSVAATTQRLPFDTRCSAVTKLGKQCKGRIRSGREWCPFHDPEIIARRQQNGSSQERRIRRKLSHMPDGYLRKIKDRASVGHAMDRLYREIRLGIITLEMGRVMFTVLNRILESGLADHGKTPKNIQRSKAERIRPKLGNLLTRTEKSAWRKAVAGATQEILFKDEQSRSTNRSSKPTVPLNLPNVSFDDIEAPIGVSLQVAL